jgi:hypothetical protein
MAKKRNLLCLCLGAIAFFAFRAPLSAATVYSAFPL